QVLRPEAGSPGPALVEKSTGIVGLGIGLDPVVHTLARHPQHLSNLGNGPPSTGFEDRERPLIHTCVLRFLQLALEPQPLPPSQFQIGHDVHLDAEATGNQTECQKTFADLLRSQKRIPSKPTEARVLPHGERNRPTAPLSSCCSSLPVAGSQSRIEWSSPTVISVFPSCANSKERIIPRCPC